MEPVAATQAPRARFLPLLVALLAGVGASGAGGAESVCRPPPLCRADVDGDGLVAAADFLALTQQLGGRPAFGVNADLDGDGWVRSSDLLLLFQDFGDRCDVECPPNTPLDLDGDGAADYIACGDFDGDGLLTMDRGCVNADPATPCDADGSKGDLLGCLEALDDPEQRILDVLPGRYEVPDPPFTSHHAISTGVEAGLLELPGGTTLTCRPGAVLTGTDERHLDPADELSVVYVPPEATGVVIEGCEIDQGWPEPYSCSGGQCTNASRMGILLEGSGHVVRDNHVHHTTHSCIYTKSGSDNLIENNLLDWCGGAWASTNVGSFPGFYAFSDDGVPVERLQVVGTRCDRIGGACINTRMGEQDEGNEISDLVVAGTRHVQTGDNADGSRGACMKLRGLTGAQIVDTRCEGTSGLSVIRGAYRYLDDPSCTVALGSRFQCVSANVDVRVAGAEILDTRGGSGLDLGGFQSGLSVSDVSVRGTDPDRRCATGPGPFRGLELEGLTLEGCGAGGLQLGRGGTPGSWGSSNPEEAVVVRDLEVRGADAWLADSMRGTGVALLQGCVGCVFENLSVQGWSDYGFAVASGYAFAANRLQGLMLEQLGDWYAGTAPIPGLPACQAGRAGEVWTVVDASSVADCTTGGGNRSNLCVCDGTTWRDTDLLGATRSASHGLALLDATATDNEIEDVVCVDARARSHCIHLGGSASGNRVADVLARDDRGLAAWNPNAQDVNNGALHLHGSVGNEVSNVTCQDLRNDESSDGRRCICHDEACTAP